MTHTSASSPRPVIRAFWSALGPGLAAAALVLAGCGTDDATSAPRADESDAFLGLDCETISQWTGVPDGYEPTQTDDVAGDLSCEWANSSGTGEVSVQVGWDAVTVEQVRSTAEGQGLPFVTSAQIEGLGGFVYSTMDDPQRDLDVRLPFHQGNLIYLTLAQRDGPVDLLASAERVAVEVVNR